MLIFVYACLLPREMMLEVQTAALFPYRIALILTLPFAISQLSRFPVRPSLVDACVIFAAFWFVISLIMTTSYRAGLVSGLSASFDYTAAYLLGRATVRTAEDLRLIFRWFLPGIVLLVLVLAIESLSHRMLMRPLLAELLSADRPQIYFRIRYGLLRAMGPFPHPILTGVFLASVVPMAWYLAHQARMRLVGCLAGLGAIFTVSTTAVIGLVIGIGVIIMDIVQSKTKIPIFALISAYLVLLLITIGMVTESGVVNVMIRYFTLDEGSGYYRMMIWQFGGAEVVANPLFGIGMRDWIRPQVMVVQSVDAYWLVMSMMHGLPMTAALALVMIGSLVAVIRSQRFRHPVDRDVGKALVAFILIAIFSGFTVHFWEAVNSWIALILGTATSFATQARFAPLPQWSVRETGRQPLAFQPMAAE